jgi:forkhead box protein N
MNINPSPSNSVNSTPVKYSNSLLSDQLPTSDYVDDSSISAADSSSSSLNSPVPYPSHNVTSQRNKHPHNVPYDPLVHTNNKPPYSFSCLIFMAIEDSAQKALPVKEIYAWILEHFPYFKNAPTGWKNSVRHNLSLNKCFQKVEKAPNLGKGSLWTVDQQYKPNLIQALTRSPFHPCSTLDPSTYFNNNKNNSSPEKSSMSRLPNPELYPYLSRKLASAELNSNRHIKSEASDESLDAVDAAAVMLSLKNGPRYRQKKEKGLHCQVITTSPSQDHTYSAADSVDPLGTDEAFESDDERIIKSSARRKIDFEDEEERKIKEGAETLLNLAGITTRKRYNSQSSEYDPYKRIKLSPQYDINDNESDERPAPFKPRLLRTKKKEGKSKVLCNNNNNDEWVKHRRELEINHHR